MSETTAPETGTALAGRDSSELLGGDIPPDGHPLRELGKRLADLLDDDHWNNCEPMLLAAWKQEQQMEAMVDRAHEALHELLASHINIGEPAAQIAKRGLWADE